MLDAMEELNTGILVLCSDESDEALADQEIVAGDLLQSAERAGRRGMRVGYEALSWSRRIKTYGAA